MRTSLKINIGSWDTLKIQVAHLDQGIQSITNHWSTKKRQAIKKEEKKEGKEAFTFTAQQAEKYQAFSRKSLFLVTHPEFVPRKRMGRQDQSNYTLNAC